MKFRPCIDIHNGKVKQIVGSSLNDNNNYAKNNFVSDRDADFYALMYKNDNLKGGHIIILNSKDSEYYNKDINSAKKALLVYPGGLQIGGGINDENAEDFLNWGASHVIVTSFVFKNAQIDLKNLDSLINSVSKNKLVLDLSCRKKDNEYYILTDRWQKFTDIKISESVLDELSVYCDEFLVHAVDVEGKQNGIDSELINILSKHQKNKITYAGGVRNLSDIKILNDVSSGRLDVTAGSALDIFGGDLKYKDVVSFCASR